MRADRSNSMRGSSRSTLPCSFLFFWKRIPGAGIIPSRIQPDVRLSSTPGSPSIPSDRAIGARPSLSCCGSPRLLELG